MFPFQMRYRDEMHLTGAVHGFGVRAGVLAELFRAKKISK
jgi:hypothetical protein